jgi:hypothetical protein
VLAAFGFVVWFAVGCRSRNEPEPPEAEPADAIQIDLAPDEKPPTFEFPDSLRSKNDSLNKFLDEFRSICERGEYERYRLAVSRQVEPIEEGRFENIWHAVAHVRIELIKRLPEMKEWPSPAYAVLAKVTLKDEYVKDEPQRYVTIVSFQEEGEWVFTPAPDERIHRAMRAALRKAEAERSSWFSETQPASTQPAAQADR